VTSTPSHISGYDPQIAAYFTRSEWFALPLKFRQRWWRGTNYGRRPPSPELLHEARRNHRYRDRVPDLRKLKATVAAAHPDRGGSSAAFIEARFHYVWRFWRAEAENGA
jgi:hypothetical protein